MTNKKTGNKLPAMMELVPDLPATEIGMTTGSKNEGSSKVPGSSNDVRQVFGSGEVRAGSGSALGYCSQGIRSKQQLDTSAPNSSKQ